MGVSTLQHSPVSELLACWFRENIGCVSKYCKEGYFLKAKSLLYDGNRNCTWGGVWCVREPFILVSLSENRNLQAGVPRNTFFCHLSKPLICLLYSLSFLKLTARSHQTITIKITRLHRPNDFSFSFFFF